MKPGFVKTHIKVRLKIEQIARLRCAGIKDQVIMRMLGISQFCISRIIKLDEYKDTEAAILVGALTKFDEVIALRTDVMKQYFASAIPASMRALVDTVLQKRDLKARLEAAREILDRDPKRSFVHAADAARLSGNDYAPSLPESVIESLSRRAAEAGADAAAGAAKAELGPSGKPN